MTPTQHSRASTFPHFHLSDHIIWTYASCARKKVCASYSTYRLKNKTKKKSVQNMKRRNEANFDSLALSFPNLPPCLSRDCHAASHPNVARYRSLAHATNPFVSSKRPNVFFASARLKQHTAGLLVPTSVSAHTIQMIAIMLKWF